MGASSGSQAWPSLPLEAWSETCATLHMWTQIVGKIRLVQSPWINHSWHVTLYVTARGSPPRRSLRHRDVRDRLRLHRPPADRAGQRRPRCAASRSSRRRSAAFYGRLMDELRKLGLHVKIHGKPNEVAEPIPFRPGRGSPLVRRGVRQPVLASPRAGGPGLQGVPRPLHRQVQPGAFLLGRARPGGHAVLRPAGAGASGRRSPTCRTGSPARPIHTKSAAAASGPAGALFPMPRSTPTPIRSRPDSRRRRVRPDAAFYSSELARVHPSLRRRPAGGLARSRRCSNSCRPPTRPPPIWPAGIAVPWNVACRP